MKIALVTGHYIPRLGYMEVHLSNAFSKLGHDVHVFTTNVFPAYLKHQQGHFGNTPKGVKVSRLKPVFTLGQIVRVRGLKQKINAYKPDLIVVIGLGKWFPKPVYDLDMPIYTLLGDNAYSHANASWKSKLLFEIFKRSTYQKAIGSSNRLYTYTPETRGIVSTQLGSAYKSALGRAIEITLGYWSSEFYFDSQIRNEWRAKLGYGHSDKVVITATRVVAEKRIHKQIEYFRNASENIKWLIIGAANNAYTAQFESQLITAIGKQRFILLPYASRSQLNNYYNAADLALFTVPAISIFEALGTGLKMRIPETPTLERLNNSVFRACSVSDAFLQSQFEYDRSGVSKEAAKHFDWISIARQILVNNPGI